MVPSLSIFLVPHTHTHTHTHTPHHTHRERERETERVGEDFVCERRSILEDDLASMSPSVGGTAGPTWVTDTLGSCLKRTTVCAWEQTLPGLLYMKI